MARPSYSDYAIHALRFYVNTHDTARPEAMDEVDAANWTACRDVMAALPVHERTVLIYLYSSRGNMCDIVEQAASLYGMPQRHVWALLHRTARNFALVRGLITAKPSNFQH